MAPRVTLRPVTEFDQDFLRTLFASTREWELACLPDDERMRATFIDSQYRVQSAAYRSTYPHASHQIIEFEGLPAGRLYVDRSSEELSLVDISLLPSYRGRGIGTALLQQLLEEVKHSGGKVLLTVAIHNAARHLYERLGFKTVSSDGFNLRQTASGQILSDCPT